MSLTASKVKALLSRAVDYFDVTTLSKIDLITKGDKTIYVDPLGNRTQPIPSDVGHNVYYVHGPKDEFRQEIHFQNGSPAQGVNGLSNEAVISVVLHRLSKQNESFPSPYNVLAIYLLQGALAALHSRVKDRQDFGIYDTDKVEPMDKDDAKFFIDMVNKDIGHGKCVPVLKRWVDIIDSINTRYISRKRTPD